jgi:NADPH:quinone reductase-like Zn-dependent oxidoreductase
MRSAILAFSFAALSLALLAAIALMPGIRLVAPKNMVWAAPPSDDAVSVMKAAVFSQAGDASVLRVASVARPAPNANQVLVKVVYAAGNPVDFKFRNDPQWPIVVLPKISGHDFAGVVDRDSKSFRKGDQVFGFVPCGLHKWGSFAEFVAPDEDHVAKMPPGMSFRTAAAVPLAAETALQALRKVPHLVAGDRVLIHAGAGGAGCFLIQLAKLRGLQVWTTCSAGYALCQSLGADRVIDYKKERFEHVADPHSFDAVFDFIGGGFGSQAALPADALRFARTGDYLLRGVSLCKRQGTYLEVLNSGWFGGLVQGGARS